MTGRDIQALYAAASRDRDRHSQVAADLLERRRALDAAVAALREEGLHPFVTFEAVAEHVASLDRLIERHRLGSQAALDYLRMIEPELE